MTKTALAKLLTLKVAAAALTVTAAGGVALAAGTGHLPGSADDGATPTARPTPSHPSGSHHHSVKSSPARDGHPSADPSPSAVALCHAYVAGAGDNPGKALESPAFTHLITAAGGKYNVAAYCSALLKAHPGTGEASHPAGVPATRHPTGGPVTRPTGPPTAHPTKRTHPVH